jgi:signal transduction histidine kinase
MFVTRATAFGDSARLNFPGLAGGELLNRRIGRVWHRRIFSLAHGLKWILTIVSIVLIGWVDFAAGSAAFYSFLYLAPIAFATWFIRVWAGVVVAVLSVLAWLLVEFSLGTDYSIPPAHLVSEAVRFGLSLAGVALLALGKKSTERLVREVVSRNRSLRLEAERCRRLEQEVVNTSAREQLRLAQDLHDGLGQYLSALTFLSKMLADDLHLHDSAQAAQADRIVALVRKTNQVTRQMNRALKIPDTQGRGLAVALRTLAADVEELTGVHCEISTDHEVPMLDEFRTMMLFRIAQEAFNNCVKHARPRSIRVSLTFVKEVLFLRVVNDGHNPEANRAGESGSGSLVMKLRAELVGAQLESGPVNADEYQVQCVLPLTRPKAYAVAM